MEERRKIKDGQIVVKNPLYQELQTHEITMQSGRTLYRFTGSYDGSKSYAVSQKQSYAVLCVLSKRAVIFIIIYLDFLQEK